MKVMKRLRHWYSRHQVAGTPESSALNFVVSIGIALASAILVEGVLFYWMPARFWSLSRPLSTIIRFAFAIAITIAILTLLYKQARQFFSKQHHPPEHVVTEDSPPPEDFSVLVTLTSKPPPKHPYKLQSCPQHWFTQPGLKLVERGAGKDNIVILATESLLNASEDPPASDTEECKFTHESNQESAESALQKVFAWHLACYADSGGQSVADTCPRCSKPSAGQPAGWPECWLKKVRVEQVDDLGNPNNDAERNEADIHVDRYSEKCTDVLNKLVRDEGYTPSQILVDVTGAKKLHSLGLFLAARKIGACVAYVDAFANESSNIYIFHETSAMEQAVHKLVSDLKTLKMFKRQLHESKSDLRRELNKDVQWMKEELEAIDSIQDEGDI